MKLAMIGAALAALTLIAGISLQLGPALAYQRLQNLDWLESASPEELRDTAHEALAFRLGDPHDAFDALVADVSSPLRLTLTVPKSRQQC